MLGNQFNFLARGTGGFLLFFVDVVGLVTMERRRLCGFSRMQKRSRPFFLLAARELQRRAEQVCSEHTSTNERVLGFVSN